MKVSLVSSNLKALKKTKMKKKETKRLKSTVIASKRSTITTTFHLLMDLIMWLKANSKKLEWNPKCTKKMKTRLLYTINIYRVTKTYMNNLQITYGTMIQLTWVTTDTLVIYSLTLAAKVNKIESTKKWYRKLNRCLILIFLFTELFQITTITMHI